MKETKKKNMLMLRMYINKVGIKNDTNFIILPLK